MKQDMINGNPSKALVAFAVPMMLGNLFQNLYVIVDLLIVGRLIGQNALAAVGATSTICMVFVNISVGLSLGCAVIVAQLFGARQYVKLKNAVNTSVLIFAGLSLLCLLISLTFGKWILDISNIPDVIRQDAGAYYYIYIIGFPGSFLFNIANSCFNALGKSRIPLGFLAASSILNIGLDLLFVGGFHLGIPGAAWATNLSQYLAAGTSLFVLFRYIRKQFPTSEQVLIFDRSLVGKVFRVALPSCVQQSAMSVGAMFLQIFVNSLGPECMAGYVAAVKVDSIAILPIVQMGNALANYTGQNVGADQYERVHIGLRTALVIDAIIAAAAAAILIPLSKPILQLFLEQNGNAGAAALQYGALYMIINSSCYFLLGINSAVAAVLRGAGDVNWSMAALLSNIVFRVIFAAVMLRLTGSELGIWWSPPVSWVIGSSIATVRFLSGKWKEKALFKKAVKQ